MEYNPQPNLIILHGNDTLAIQKAVAGMIADMGDPGTAEMNIARLDGKTHSREEIKTACDTLPFLSDRRLVLVTNPLNRLQGEDNRRFFENLFERMAPTTSLVLVIEDTFERKKWSAFPANHWLHGWIKLAGGQAQYRSMTLPEAGAMPGWITAESKARGGNINRDAAQALAGLTGSDTRMAAQELEKLLAYVGYARTIKAADVETVSITAAQHNIFDLVDNLANNNKQVSLRLVHGLLEEQDGLSLLAMINRQFRMLILAREILDQGGGQNDIQMSLGLHPYVAQKVAGQARRFSPAALEMLYRQLLEMDIAIKTGKSDAALALDQFVAELSFTA